MFKKYIRIFIISSKCFWIDIICTMIWCIDLLCVCVCVCAEAKEKCSPISPIHICTDCMFWFSCCCFQYCITIFQPKWDLVCNVHMKLAYTKYVCRSLIWMFEIMMKFKKINWDSKQVLQNHFKVSSFRMSNKYLRNEYHSTKSLIYLHWYFDFERFLLSKKK